MTENYYIPDESPQAITETIAGKVVEKVTDESAMDDFLVLHFADGTKLKIRYDYLYHWEFEK